MTTSTGPTLTTLWLNDLQTPSDYQMFQFMQTYSRDTGKGGERRVYGNGRLRFVSPIFSIEDWNVTLIAVTPTQAAWLESHAGRTLVARDDRGHRIFCAYGKSPFSEHPYNEESDTSLSLLQVTATLAV